MRARDPVGRPQLPSRPPEAKTETARNFFFFLSFEVEVEVEVSSRPPPLSSPRPRRQQLLDFRCLPLSPRFSFTIFKKSLLLVTPPLTPIS
jgi:hypothetical protein